MGRLLTTSEKLFISKMLKRSKYKSYSEQLSDMKVEDMADGGMGSLLFISKNGDRRLGVDIAQLNFTDLDGVSVIATLSLDNHNELFELDIWKTDFSKLIELPFN